MIVPLEKPGTPEELVHFGVKGMRWGVRKEDETSGRKLSKETQVKVNAHSKQLVDKFESPDHKLTPEQKKKIAYTIAGTVAVGAVIGGAYYLNQRSNLAKESSYATRRAKELAANGNKQHLFNKYLRSMDHLVAEGAEGSISKVSYNRPEFELPAGTIFRRVSSGKESTFSNITYASASKADYDRYVAWFGNLMPHEVSFTSNQALKVPKLDTVLNTLQEVTGSSKEEAVKAYSELSGYKWDTPVASKLLSSLKSKGYSAIIDENDAGLLSERPLVIFNHSGMGPKISRRMTQDQILSHMLAAKDFRGRK